MRASNFGERKLTELDFTRLTNFTAAGAMRQLADILDQAEVVPPCAIPAKSWPGSKESCSSRRRPATA